jgi:AcrR family transcriptional regulator
VVELCNSRVAIYVQEMAYPSKIDSQVIINAAMTLVEKEGDGALTLRRLACELNVTANALYRYYPSRDALIASVADAVAQRLNVAIEDGVADVEGTHDCEARVRKLLEVYSDFAEKNPALYQTFFSARREAVSELPYPRNHEVLWTKVVTIIEPLTGSLHAPAAAVTIWGLLHGIWSLRRAELLGGKKPSEVNDYAFDALIRGFRCQTV